ncbi:MAG: hypothetical protein MUP55_04185, partial [Candidatus Aenigmarchaeota archaeon]|nr:hypothetical protein [Candidatus Aenigmarchaeota archaeon]
NRIYFGGWDCNFYCITEDGKLVWKVPTSSGTQSKVYIEPYNINPIHPEFVLMVEEPTEEKKKEQQQLSDYGEMKSEYASAGMGDYLGKKKRGYI